MRGFATRAWLALFLAGCAGQVIPPSQPAAPLKSEKEFPDSFERTWQALVDYATSSSFIVDSAAKDSGLLVLSFSDKAEPFIDCGSFTSNSGKTSPTVQVIGRLSDSRLDGKLNISLRAIDQQSTGMQVKALYKFTAVAKDWSSAWSFTTGQSDTQVAGQFHHEVTCRPSGSLESSILSGVAAKLVAGNQINYWIQLAALKTTAEANRVWTRILAKHHELLGTLTLRIERADLGNQGVYYRVQAGPFADDSSARAVCVKLKARKQACLVKP